MVKRDAELKLHKISQHYEGRLQQWTDRPAVSMSITIPSHKKRQLKVQDVQKVKSKKVNAEKVVNTGNEVMVIHIKDSVMLKLGVFFCGRTVAFVTRTL